MEEVSLAHKRRNLLHGIAVLDGLAVEGDTAVYCGVAVEAISQEV